jgi:hypothetical protein
MNPYDTTKQRAEEIAIITRWQRSVEAGMVARGLAVEPVSDEAIAAHVNLVFDLMAHYRVSMSAQKTWMDRMSADEIAALALAFARRKAGKRGAKALRDKYGDQVATEIVLRHSGKRPSFQ